MSGSARPSVLFVCVKNGGKSQIAAALMRHVAGDRVDVMSAGTEPGGALNSEAEQAVAEVGASMAGEFPKPIDSTVLARADRVVVLGSEAHVEPMDGMAGSIVTWETDEPSARGITGMERMRLVRDDISERVRALVTELSDDESEPLPASAAGSGQESAVPSMAVDRETLTGQLVADLTYSYRGVFDTVQVREAVADAWDLLEPRSTIRAFLPILVARQAREQLMATAQAEGKVAKKVPEVLFVCVHNAGRSQMAAALTEHLSARRVHVRSAGSAPTGEINPQVIEVLRERGIALGTAYPKPLSDSVIQAADVIITMGCGDTCPYFPGKRYEDWEVADPAGQPIDVVREIRDDIQARVTTLLRQILD